VGVRPLKLAEELNREVSRLLRFETRDPRLGTVRIQFIEVTPDLRLAKVHYTCSQTIERDVKIGLEKASGFWRTRLAKGLSLKRVPEFKFYKIKEAEYWAKDCDELAPLS